CLLNGIEEPVVTVPDGENVWSLMIDTNAPTESDEKKYWKTSDEEYILYEYDSSSDNKRVFELYAGIAGTAHVIDRGSFFYQASRNKPRVIKYFLNNQTSQVLDIPGVTAKNRKSLYSSKLNSLDFNVDENGLWVLFADPNSNNTAVMKVNDDILEIENIANVTVHHQEFEEMFIASGILYGIKGKTDENMTITFGLDLYTDTLYKLDIKLSKWLKPAKSATYDYVNKHLRVINKDGQLLTYSLICE
ncbi:hypothetical protein ILUMI_04716, partial [Ignelater luminosus]